MTNLRNVGISLLAAAALALPAAAKSKEVTCADGTTSSAGRGACSHHGGVAESGKAAKESKKEKGEARAESKKEKSEARAEGKKGEARSDRTPSGEEPGSRTTSKSGGILGGLFGHRNETAQGRSSTTSPRRSTRDAKSAKPTAHCKDGTTSYSAHHSGTCSNHGGVAEWLDK